MIPTSISQVAVKIFLVIQAGLGVAVLSFIFLSYPLFYMLDFWFSQGEDTFPTFVEK
jgi:hypothetical protein